MWSAGIQEPSDIVGTPIESIIKEMSKQDRTSIHDRVTILITQMPETHVTIEERPVSLQEWAEKVTAAEPRSMVTIILALTKKSEFLPCARVKVDKKKVPLLSLSQPSIDHDIICV